MTVNNGCAVGLGLAVRASSDFAGPDYQQRIPGRKRCDGRRVHPFSTEHFVQCEREIGHAGWHRQRNRVWDDNNPWAIIDEFCQKLTDAGGSIWRIRRAG